MGWNEANKNEINRLMINRNPNEKEVKYVITCILGKKSKINHLEGNMWNKTTGIGQCCGRIQLLSGRRVKIHVS